MDLRKLGAVGERLAVTGNTTLLRGDQRGIHEDGRKRVAVMTDRNGLPGLVSLELGERQTIRHLERVLGIARTLVTRSPRLTTHDGERYRDAHAAQHDCSSHRCGSCLRPIVRTGSSSPPHRRYPSQN